MLYRYCPKKLCDDMLLTYFATNEFKEKFHSSSVASMRHCITHLHLTSRLYNIMPRRSTPLLQSQTV
jgi:hypothetical protein